MKLLPVHCGRVPEDLAMKDVIYIALPMAFTLVAIYLYNRRS